MQFKFDPNQPHQTQAIQSVVDLFEGQSADLSNTLFALPTKQVVKPTGQQSLLQDTREEIGAIANHLILDEDAILQNLQYIQDKNGLNISTNLRGMHFSTEMETGTGKTYVYLRTVFELSQKYGFNKFIILVPSVAIKEGVITSIEYLQEHFAQLYATPFDAQVYNGKNPTGVRSFATSTTIQILVMTIQSIKGTKETRIIKQERNDLGGIPAIDYLASTNPIIIMDEPQNMESELSQVAIEDLNPLCTLRYSATHKNEYNLVFRLDPIDAHDKKLVKQIVVSDMVVTGAQSTPYIKLIQTKRDPWRVQLELLDKNGSDTKKKKIWLKQGENLQKVTNNDIYDNNWIVNSISIEPPEVELTHCILQQDESIGDDQDSIFKEMIRQTIKEHLRTETRLKEKGIKVLSLFFIDKVANYVAYEEDGAEIAGKFRIWFDELFKQEISKSSLHQTLIPYEPEQVRKAYFAQMKKGGKTTYVDSTEKGSQKDEDAYNLIMKDKKTLLSFDEPTRFIFSHSALREGWDNPNVFQICVLREMGSALQRRQTIGRGMRLPLTQDGDRISDQSIAQLTVIANESYAEFAQALQSEYEKDGLIFGKVRKEEFSNILSSVNTNAEVIGSLASTQIWEYLTTTGILDKNGKVTANFMPENDFFTLNLPDEFRDLEQGVIEKLENCRIEKFVKQARKRISRKLNKEVVWSPEFEEFWYRISRRTTYRVSVDSKVLIAKVLESLSKEPAVEPLRIEMTQNRVNLKRGGVSGQMIRQATEQLKGNYSYPNIITEVQEETKLTRATIAKILQQSERLPEFMDNPNDFLQLIKRVITSTLSNLLVDGIEYEQIDGYLYELRELQEDGEQEKQRFLDQLYKVKNKQKTTFDYVVYDSGTEQQFAKLLDSREDVKFFIKLPDKFKIPTPVGSYNPDWAIVKQEDGQEKIYLIRETKSTHLDHLRRPIENDKIKCGKKHFDAIGIDFATSTPEKWNI